jgi:FAD/FMN-containing dehydrogenase
MRDTLTAWKEPRPKGKRREAGGDCHDRDQRSPIECLKAILDPKGILNPGKVL